MGMGLYVAYPYMEFFSADKSTLVGTGDEKDMFTQPTEECCQHKEAWPPLLSSAGIFNHKF